MRQMTEDRAIVRMRRIGSIQARREVLCGDGYDWYKAHVRCLNVFLLRRGQTENFLKPVPVEKWLPSGWNARYIAYCAGEKPREVLKRDAERWPGGAMCAFITWIGERWREFLAANPKVDRGFLSDEDHRAFTGWLLRRTPTGQKQQTKVM